MHGAVRSRRRYAPNVSTAKVTYRRSAFDTEEKETHRRTPTNDDFADLRLKSHNTRTYKADTASAAANTPTATATATANISSSSPPLPFSPLPLPSNRLSSSSSVVTRSVSVQTAVGACGDDASAVEHSGGGGERIDALTSAVSALTDRVRVLQSDLVHSELTINEARRRYDAALTAHIAAAAAATARTSDLETEVRRLSDAHVVLQSECDEKLLYLNRMMNDALAREARAVADSIDLTDKLQRRSGGNESGGSELVVLQSERIELESALSTTSNALLLERATTAKQNEIIGEMQRQIDQLTRALVDVNNSVSTRDSAVAAESRSLSDWALPIAEMKQTIMATEREKEYLTNKLSETVAALDQIKLRLFECQTRVDCGDTTIATLQSARAAAERESNSAVEEMNRVSALLSVSESELSALRSSHESVQSRCAFLESAYAKSSSSLEQRRAVDDAAAIVSNIRLDEMRGAAHLSLQVAAALEHIQRLSAAAT